MAKCKVPDRPEDCVTIAEKIAYSNMIKEKWENIPWDAPPSYIDKLLDEYPVDPAYPHSHPEWSANYAKSEREKNRAQRKLMRRGMTIGRSGAHSANI